ncbi:hypothetical protein, partial [Burkholderia pseudomallei]|uniref:hypothetical protein n=1 Tax=Burkholderia pseudomallei TaxID=28450 RepID=UPI001CA4D968
MPPARPATSRRAAANKKAIHRIAFLFRAAIPANRRRRRDGRLAQRGPALIERRRLQSRLASAAFAAR